MIPNYPLFENGQPKTARFPRQIDNSMIVQAYAEKLIGVENWIKGKFVAVRLWHNGFYLINNAKVFDTLEECQAACDMSNQIAGYNPEFVTWAISKAIISPISN